MHDDAHKRGLTGLQIDEKDKQGAGVGFLWSECYMISVERDPLHATGMAQSLL
jgi:hypothetical protein